VLVVRLRAVEAFFKCEREPLRFLRALGPRPPGRDAESIRRTSAADYRSFLKGAI
jgi:hypothetical protein